MAISISLPRNSQVSAQLATLFPSTNQVGAGTLNILHVGFLFNLGSPDHIMQALGQIHHSKALVWWATALHGPLLYWRACLFQRGHDMSSGRGDRAAVPCRSSGVLIIRSPVNVFWSETPQVLTSRPVPVHFVPSWRRAKA